VFLLYHCDYSPDIQNNVLHHLIALYINSCGKAVVELVALLVALHMLAALRMLPVLLVDLYVLPPVALL